MTIRRDSYPELYAPGLNKVIFENFTYRDEEYSKYINVEDPGPVSFFEDYEMAGFGDVPIKPEGEAIQYDVPTPGNKVRYEWTAYGRGYRVTFEALQDQRYGHMQKMAAALGRAFRHKVEIIGASLLNNAFTTAGGFDNVALCSASHPRYRIGGVQSNVANAAFSATALENALIQFETYTDHSGVPIVVAPAWIVCGPTLAPRVREVIGSAFKPGVATNEINILADAGLGILVLHYLTSSTAWFVIGDKSEHDLRCFWRNKFNTSASDDFDSGDGKHKGYMRLGVGWGQWQGVWGSTP